MSDVGDDLVDTELLLDNFGGDVTFFSTAANTGFESGLAGYASLGNVVPTGGSVRGFFPTEGFLMSHLTAEGADTSGFTNDSGDPGTDGSLISFVISALAGDFLTFDWNFFNTELTDEGGNPFLYRDFAFLNIESLIPGVDPYYKVLAEVAVPTPAAIWLMGTALIGLLGIPRKKVV